MANVYWIGGAGTWDNINTANWAWTSGGTGPASPPTSTDTAIFDNLSGTGAVSIYQNALCLVCNFGGSGITAKLVQSNITSFSTLNITAGSFSTNSFDFTCTTVNVTGGTFTTPTSGIMTLGSIVSSGSVARSIILGNITMYLSSSAGLNFSGTNLTFTRATSNINLTNVAPTFAGNGSTFYNVSFSSTAITTATISGANSFNNLYFSSKAASGVSNISIASGSSQTITGLFSIPASAFAGSARYFLYSPNIGNPITLTAATTSLTDCDFMDITGGGTGLSGTRLGNCGGNTGITFPTAKTVYWNLTGAQNFSATGWATTSAGVPSTANFPLPQDTATFTNTGPAAGTTITINSAYNIGSLTFATRTNTLTLASGTTVWSIFGNITLSSATSITGTGTLNLNSRSSQTITCAGKYFTQIINQNTYGGTVNFADAFGSSNIYNHIYGALSTNYTFSCKTFNSSYANNRSIAFGAGQLYCSGYGTVFTTAVTTGLTITGTPVVNVTSVVVNSISVATGTTVGISNLFSFNFTGGNYALALPTGNLFNNLNFTGWSGSLTNSTRTVYGDFIMPTGSPAAGSNTITFAGSGSKTITTPLFLDCPVVFNGVLGTFNIGSDFRATTITHSNGTLNLNGYSFTATSYTTVGAGTQNITFNNGYIFLQTDYISSFNITPLSNFTTTMGTGSGYISMSPQNSATFEGGSSVYNCGLRINDHGGGGQVYITGANTFDNISINTNAGGIIFPSATTTRIVNGFTASGSVYGNLYLGSSISGTAATLSKASGIVDVSYCTINNLTATGGATWKASTSNGNVDGGGNTGWVFTAPPVGGSTVDLASQSVSSSNLVGDIYSTTNLSSNAAANSLASGSLTLPPGFSGDAACLSTGLGAINSTLAIGGNALDTVSLVGAINSTLSITGNALEASTLTGAINSTLNLSSSAFVITTSTAVLSITSTIGTVVSLAGACYSNTTAIGSIYGAVDFGGSAAALTQSIASIKMAMYIGGQPKAQSGCLGGIDLKQTLLSNARINTALLGAIYSKMSMTSNSYVYIDSNASLTFPSLGIGVLSITPIHTKYTIIPIYTKYEIRVLT